MYPLHKISPSLLLTAEALQLSVYFHSMSLLRILRVTTRRRQADRSDVFSPEPRIGPAGGRENQLGRLGTSQVALLCRRQLASRIACCGC